MIFQGFHSVLSFSWNMQQSNFCIRAVFFASVTFLWKFCVHYAIVRMQERFRELGNWTRLVMAITGAQVIAEPLQNSIKS